MVMTGRLDGVAREYGSFRELDPREVLLAAPMSRLQVVAISVTVALFALDGFDVLAITFAAPAVARDGGSARPRWEPRSPSGWSAWRSVPS